MVLRYLSILTLLLCSCNSAKKSHPEESQNVVSVSSGPAPSVYLSNQPVNTNGNLHFSVYYPSCYAEDRKFPVMIFFDPHGSPDIPLNKYRELADKYGFIFLGSHESKNGNPAQLTADIIDGLSNQARMLPKADTALIYCGGFSGGGRVAAMMGLSPVRIEGLLTCGAGVAGGAWFGVPPYVIISMAGTSDMNLQEVKSFSTQKKDLMTRYFQVLYDGKHEWPPLSEMEFSLITFKRMAMRDKKIPVDETFIRSSGDWLNQYLQTKDDPIQKSESCYNIIRSTEALADISSLENQYQQIKLSSQYKNAVKNEEQLARDEENTKSRLLNEVMVKDTLWWRKTISALYDTSAFQSDKPRIAMIHRIQGYLSLTIYSALNRAVMAMKTDQGVHLSTLYRQVDPFNPEAWFLSAVVAMQLGMKDIALQYFENAVDLGFNDINRCKTEQFFSSLQSDNRFNSIISKIN